jgi:hypothetical protein
MRAGKQLPSGRFVAAAEPGRYVGAPAQEIRRAETQTVRRGASAEPAVRTVVGRAVVPGPTKDRWQPLFTTTAAPPLDVRTMLRARQGPEPA